MRKKCGSIGQFWKGTRNKDPLGNPQKYTLISRFLAISGFKYQEKYFCKYILVRFSNQSTRWPK